MVKTTALLEIRHNGQIYFPEKEIELEQNEYVALLGIKAVKKINTSDDDNGEAGGGKNPPPCGTVILEQAYASKTNAEQLDYLKTLDDVQFKALDLNQLIQMSKSRAKTYINKRSKLLVGESKE